MIRKNGEKEKVYRISQLGNRMDIDVSDATRLTLIFSAKNSYVWTTPAVIAIRASLDNFNIVELPSTITVNAVGSVFLDVSNYKYIHLVVTTAESTSPSDIYVSYVANDFM